MNRLKPRRDRHWDPTAQLEGDREPLHLHVRRAHPHRWRRRAWAFVVPLVLLGLGALAVYPILSGRTREPIEARQIALKAVEEARDANAAHWVPAEMVKLEAAYQTAVQEERGQAARIIFFRNFAGVSQAYMTVHKLGRQTTEAAQDRYAQVVLDAQEAVRKAERTLRGANHAADRMPFPRGGRMMLQTARIHLSEASIFLNQKDPEEAANRAAVAMGEAQAACRAALPLAGRFADGEQVRAWRRMIDDTIAGSRRTGAAAIVVYKEKNLLNLYRGGKLVRSYVADMGSNSIAQKFNGGDRATPEGRYKITSKKGHGQSRYYRALLLNYPNDEDRRRFEQARRRGEVTRGTGLGGLIEVHGEGGRGDDWTLGCVAISNRDIDDLFGRVDVGTPVTIVGGDGKGGNFSDLMPMLSDPDSIQVP
jgi:L,D-peptidoglycan transpeptidase YkuD (ErfK/YbiS/YcfS/YnhG family)